MASSQTPTPEQLRQERTTLMQGFHVLYDKGSHPETTLAIRFRVGQIDRQLPPVAIDLWPPFSQAEQQHITQQYAAHAPAEKSPEQSPNAMNEIGAWWLGPFGLPAAISITNDAPPELVEKALEFGFNASVGAEVGLMSTGSGPGLVARSAEPYTRALRSKPAQPLAGEPVALKPADFPTLSHSSAGQATQPYGNITSAHAPAAESLTALHAYPPSRQALISRAEQALETWLQNPATGTLFKVLEPIINTPEIRARINAREADSDADTRFIEDWQATLKPRDRSGQPSPYANTQQSAYGLAVEFSIEFAEGVLQTTQRDGKPDALKIQQFIARLAAGEMEPSDFAALQFVGEEHQTFVRQLVGRKDPATGLWAKVAEDLSPFGPSSLYATRAFEHEQQSSLPKDEER